jgi:hypothetical protein
LTTCLRAYLFLSLIWLAVALPVQAVVERRVERSFPVTENAALKVDSFYGEVTVKEVAEAKEIRVSVLQTADVEDEAEMDRRLAILDLNIDRQADGTVAVAAQFRRAVTFSWENWPPVALSFEITIPRRCQVEIRTGEAKITVGSLTGDVRVTTETGPVFVHEIEGSLTVRSRSGPVGITACSKTLDVATDTANILVGRALGRTTLASRGGDIEVQRALGEITVRGNGSDAQIGFVAPVRATADLALSGGTLVLQLENNVAANLDLRSSWLGRIHLRGELPLEVTAGGIGKSSLQAKVNGGGPNVVARVSGGHVWVHALEPLPLPEE